MLTATLTAPFNINPTGAADGAKSVAKLQLRHAEIDFVTDSVRVHYVALDANGVQVDERVITASSAGVQTWVGNQEATILNALMTKLATSGTVA